MDDDTDQTLDELGGSDPVRQDMIGISWTTAVSEQAAAADMILAEPDLTALIGWFILDDVRLVDADGTDLGPIRTDEVFVDEVDTDVVIGPAGWLAAAAGRWLSVTAIDGSTIEVHALDEPPTPTDAQLAAVRAGYDSTARPHPVRTLLTPDDNEIFYTDLAALSVEMVRADADAFQRDPVPPGSVLYEAAGFEVHGFNVGPPGTDWPAVEEFQRNNLLKFRHQFNDEQTDMFLLLYGAGKTVMEAGATGLGETIDEQSNAVVLLATILDDPHVAMTVWESWADEGLVGPTLDPFVNEFIAYFDDQPIPGQLWLRARHALTTGDTAEAVHLYALAAAADLDHTGLLLDRAALEADHGDAAAAKRLIERAGIRVPGAGEDATIEPDALTPLMALGHELAIEVGAYASIKARATAKRNDPCPCGSGKKYKQCHIDREQHPLDARSGWLYEKAMRFLAQTQPNLVFDIVDEVLGAGDRYELAEMLAESFFPIDLAFSEGGVFAEFLEHRRLVLPADEVELGTSWIDVHRGIYEVMRSTSRSLDLVEVTTRERITIDDTVPDEPLTVGTFVVGRPLPIGTGLRMFGGMLPVAPEHIDVMAAAFSVHDLQTSAAALGPIFDVELFDDDPLDDDT